MTYKEFIDAWNKHDHTGAWTCWIRLDGIGNKKSMVVYDQEGDLLSMNIETGNWAHLEPMFKLEPWMCRMMSQLGQEARDTSFRTRYDTKRWWFPIYGSKAVWALVDEGNELADYYYHGYFKVDHGDIVARLGSGYKPDKDDAVYTGTDLAEMKPYIKSTVWSTLMTFKKEFKKHDSI